MDSESLVLQILMAKFCTKSTEKSYHGVITPTADCGRLLLVNPFNSAASTSADILKTVNSLFLPIMIVIVVITLVLICVAYAIQRCIKQSKLKNEIIEYRTKYIYQFSQELKLPQASFCWLSDRINDYSNEIHAESKVLNFVCCIE